MDQPIISPEQDDMLREFDLPEADLTEVYLPDEEEPTGALPSADEILHEFDLPDAEAAEEYPPVEEISRETPLSGEEMPTDPLAEADELPDLFPPEAYRGENDDDENRDENTTVVERPVQKKKSTARKVLHVFAVIGKYVLALVLVAAIAVAGLFGYLTLAEYNPAHAEVAQRGAVTVPDKFNGNSLSILTFNTGYGALGEAADFFMDGGKSVNPDSVEQVKNNMLGIEAIVRSADADFVFLQELDTDSDRSYELNQWLQYEYDLEDYESRFAMNYSCDYVPYPLPETIGKVHSGIATFSRYDISSATRYSLPCPFSWPTRVANLKRCMLVTRIPLAGKEEQELVLINFHLEAYDDGEGKAA
ncbi:MAG: hypothetical protein CW335_03455, partial [Clostridiales bacterium]|nr:hypothetical protein [Clostridiales bacterium]